MRERFLKIKSNSSENSTIGSKIGKFTKIKVKKTLLIWSKKSISIGSLEAKKGKWEKKREKRNRKRTGKKENKQIKRKSLPSYLLGDYMMMVEFEKRTQDSGKEKEVK